MKFIYSIFRRYKFSLLLIYFYMLVAQLLFLAEPFILGKAIDGLLAKNYIWLIIFLVVELLHNVFMYRRMVFDTKVYVKIYNDIIFNFLRNNKEIDTSAKIARTDMSHSIIGFLEGDIHFFIMAIVTVIGSLFFIFMQHALTGVIVVCSILPITIIAILFYKKIAQSTKVGNTHYEQKASIMHSEDEFQIDTYFKRRARIIVMQSTLQGRNWASLNVAKTIFLVLSLFIFTSKNIDMTQGEAIAMYAYLNQFIIALMSIPIAMETITRIKDVIGRIKS